MQVGCCLLGDKDAVEAPEKEPDLARIEARVRGAETEDLTGSGRLHRAAGRGLEADHGGVIDGSAPSTAASLSRPRPGPHRATRPRPAGSASSTGTGRDRPRRHAGRTGLEKDAERGDQGDRAGNAGHRAEEAAPTRPDQSGQSHSAIMAGLQGSS